MELNATKMHSFLAVESVFSTDVENSTIRAEKLSRRLQAKASPSTVGRPQAKASPSTAVFVEHAYTSARDHAWYAAWCLREARSCPTPFHAGSAAWAVSVLVLVFALPTSGQTVTHFGLTSSNTATSYASYVTISGLSFGTTSQTPTSAFGASLSAGTMCATTSWTSSTTVQCDLSNMIVRPGQVDVQVPLSAGRICVRLGPAA